MGSRVYKGFQGSGKTVSMARYALKVHEAFPEALVASNFSLPFAYRLQTDAQVKEALAFHNGAKGVLILLDEAHLFFNKKTGIGLDVLSSISQQRKNRRRIVFSSQIWEELDISLRKQVKEIVDCHTLFRNIEINSVRDGETLTYDKLEGQYVAKKIRTEIFKINKVYTAIYDTFETVLTNEEYERRESAELKAFVQQASSLRRRK